MGKLLDYRDWLLRVEWAGKQKLRKVSLYFKDGMLKPSFIYLLDVVGSLEFLDASNGE